MEEDDDQTDEALKEAERQGAPPEKRRPQEPERPDELVGGQRAEDGGQGMDGSGRRAEDGGQRAEGGGQEGEFPPYHVPGTRHPAPGPGGELWVGRGRREEGDSGQGAEDRGRRTAGSGPAGEQSSLRRGGPEVLRERAEDRGEFQSYPAPGTQHPAPRSYGGRGRGGGGGRGGGWRGDGGEDRGGWGERAERQRPPPEQVERQIVLPGDKLDDGHLKDGSGTYREEDGIYSACLGLRSIRSDIVSVIPLSGKYIPRVGDIVIGKVIEMTPSAWVIDLNSPYVAPLPGSETPWTVEFGETSKYMAIGDTLLVQIRDVNEVRRVGVTMIGPDLRKLVGGQTIDVDATKVPRIIGRGGSMISLLKRMTRCRIMVGQNGRIWLDGTVEDVTVAMGAIRMIEANAHRLGLTDAVAGFIQGMRGDMQARREKREKEQEAREERAILEDRVHRAVQPSMELEEGKKEEE